MKERLEVAFDLITWYELRYSVDIEQSVYDICRWFDVIAQIEERDPRSIKFEEIQAYITTNFPVEHV